MKRIYATFDDESDAGDARTALREADLEPTAPEFENPFFDPLSNLPEVTGLLWGGLLGGLIGAALLYGLDQYVFWVPRISPIMTAGPYSLVFLGFGLGVAVGGFVGGVLGTATDVRPVDDPRLVVSVPDHRVDGVTETLRSNGATNVETVVTHHEHPHRKKASEPGS